MHIKQVLGSKVLVKKTAISSVKKTFLALPGDAFYYDSIVAEVIMVGPGDILSDGSREPMPISVGDNVLVWAGYLNTVVVDPKENLSLIDISEIEGTITGFQRDCDSNKVTASFGTLKKEMEVESIKEAHA